MGTPRLGCRRGRWLPSSCLLACDNEGENDNEANYDDVDTIDALTTLAND